MPRVEVAGRQLHVEREGSGPPLLLIQGLSGNHRHWGRPFLERLGKDFDVLAYDHRGVGLSDKVDPEVPFSLRDLADDAAGVLDALGLERAHVLGISMGGMVAQELALSHPERVDRLALGCTYCGGDGSALTSPEVGQKLYAGMTSGDLDVARRTAFEVNTSPAFAADPANYEAFLASTLEDPTPVPMILAQVRAISEWSSQDRLPGLAKPTLLIHGAADQMLVVANGRLIASLLPDARLVEYDGVGHLFWLERRDETLALLREHYTA